jgi:uncharacterized delta-60 repeat protein
MRIFTFTLALICFVSTTVAQQFIPDTSFSGDGTHAFNYFANIDRGYGCAIQPDQKAVMAGLSKNPVTGFFELGISRILMNGQLDPSFNGTGISYVSMGNQGSIGGQTPRVFITPDGKITAVNTGRSATGLSQDLMVCRLDSSGHLDNSFGISGVVFVDMTGTELWPDVGSSIDIDAQGNIYICGGTRNGSTPLDNDFAVVKLLPNGTLDPVFDGDGKQLYNLTGGAEFGSGVKVLADGSIVFGGATNNSMVIAKVDSAGVLDPLFGTGGFVNITSPSAYMVDLGIDDQERIIATGIQGNGSAVVVRYLSNGTPDPAFGISGAVSFSASGTVEVSSLVVMPDNRILVAGWANTASNGTDFMVTRIDTTGTLDLTFNGTGYVVRNIVIGSTNEECYGMGLLADGRIFLAGTIRYSAFVNEDIGVMLLKPDSATGVVTIDSPALLEIFPNPVTDHLNFRLRDRSVIIITDISGRIMQQIEFEPGLHTLDFSTVSSGIYFIREMNSGAVKKIVRQ